MAAIEMVSKSIIACWVDGFSGFGFIFFFLRHFLFGPHTYIIYYFTYPNTDCCVGLRKFRYMSHIQQFPPDIKYNTLGNDT